MTTLDLYHRTSEDAARAIVATGRFLTRTLAASLSPHIRLGAETRLPGEGPGPAANGGEAVPAAEVVEMLGDGEEFDPVSEDPEFYAWLVDQGGMVTKNRESLKWVEQQRAEAVRKRQKQGATPKL